jgi:hypothetical protein
MARVVDDPRGIEGQSIQDFAQKGCNSSRDAQVHLYLICHRSLQEYVGLSAIHRATGMSKADQDEWNKIAGRFREFNMRTTDHEIFNLIDHVVVQQENAEWQGTKEAHRDEFDEISGQAQRLGLFPEFGRADISSIITLGAYPLHPMAAYSLPRISQEVAQNERTMFCFLSDSGSDTLGPFIRKHNVTDKTGRLCFFTADGLWEFFLKNIQEHPEHRRAAAHYAQASVKVDADDKFGKRVIRTVALLEVIRSDRTPCTEEVIGFCLGLQLSEKEVLREKLKSLCSSEGTRGKVLHQNTADGSYRFASASSGVPLEEKIDHLVEERMNLVGPGDHLRRIASAVKLESTIPATNYSDDFMLARNLKLIAADLIDLRNPSSWLSDPGEGAFLDGQAIVVLCETGEEIRQAKSLAAGALKHQQVLLGIPAEPVRLASLLRKHEALQFLEKSQGNLYGPGADLREEWEQQTDDCTQAISQKVSALLDPQKQMLEWYANGSTSKGIRTVSQLRNVASDMMRKVFPLTPRIAHDKSVTEEGADSPKRARRNIIDKLMQPEGPTLLGQETNSQEKTMIRAFLTDQGILIQAKGWADRFEIRKPPESTNEAVAAVWGETESAIEKAKSGPLPMTDLVTKLRRPPYGMRTRSISLFVAPALRPYVLRGNLSLEYQGVLRRQKEATLAQSGLLTIGEAVLGCPGQAFIVPSGYACLGSRPRGAVHGGLSPQEVITPLLVSYTAIEMSFRNLEVALDGEVRRGRTVNSVKLRIANPNSVSVLITDLESNLLTVNKSPPFKVEAGRSVEIDVVINAERVNTKEVTLMPRIKAELLGETHITVCNLRIGTTGAALSDRAFEDDFDN